MTPTYLASLSPYNERPLGITRTDRERLAIFPGVKLVVSQPLTARVDEMVSGVHADVVAMLYGGDLELLVEKASEIARVANEIKVRRHTRIDRVRGQQYLTIMIDRSAIARYGLNVADVNHVVETAIAGNSETEIYEGGHAPWSVLVSYIRKLRREACLRSRLYAPASLYASTRHDDRNGGRLGTDTLLFSSGPGCEIQRPLATVSLVILSVRPLSRCCCIPPYTNR